MAGIFWPAFFRGYLADFPPRFPAIFSRVGFLERRIPYFTSAPHRVFLAYAVRTRGRTHPPPPLLHRSSRPARSRTPPRWHSFACARSESARSGATPRTCHVRIRQLNLTDSRTVDPDALARTATLGFDHVLLAGWAVPHIHPDTLASTFAACRSHGLLPLLDLALDRFPAEAAARARWLGGPCPCPGGSPDATDSHLARRAAALVRRRARPRPGGGWSAQIREAIDAGAAGFCCRAPSRVPGRHWAEIIETAAAGSTENGGDGPLFLAFTPAPTRNNWPTSPSPLLSTARFCSLLWWDYRSAWLTEEMARLRDFGRVLAAPALAPDGTEVLAARRALWTAAAIGDGMMVPAGARDRRPR